MTHKWSDIRRPKVGDTIYVKTSLYIDHGADDVLGGKATVTRVEKDRNGDWFVSVKEHPGNSYNWSYLGPRQAELKKKYGRRHARSDPDYRRSSRTSPTKGRN